MYLNYMYKVV